jgi:hypothetical protein
MNVIYGILMNFHADLASPVMSAEFEDVYITLASRDLVVACRSSRIQDDAMFLQVLFAFVTY